MTIKDAQAALIAADPSRSYCIETNTWSYAPTHAPTRTTEETFFVYVIPGLTKEKPECAQIKGPTLAAAVTRALEAIDQFHALNPPPQAAALAA